MSRNTGATSELWKLDDTRDALRDRLLSAARALILVEDRRADLLGRLVDRDAPSSHERRSQARQARDDAEALAALVVGIERIDARSLDESRARPRQRHPA